MQRVIRAHKAHAEYKRYQESLSDPDDDDGPQNDDAWLYEDLTILGKLYTRLRDREQLMELIFEVRLYALCMTVLLTTPYYRVQLLSYLKISSPYSILH